MPFLRPDPVDMTPDPNGLFNLPQVTVLADTRGLLTESVSDIICQVRKSADGEPVQIVATQPGLWRPVEIFSKCRKALGEKSYEIADRAVLNPLLDELLIARVVAADGVNPFLTRKTEHIVCHRYRAHDFWLEPNPTLFQAHIRAKYPEYFGQVRVIAQPGDWTKPMLFVMCQRRNPRSSDYRRALYALSDSGLIDLKMSGRWPHGIGTATYEWTDLARIPPKLDAEDADALATLVA